jgi:EAL domain-containing protein (putative c-di-GMP-specific phosphodiesterase class I)
MSNASDNQVRAHHLGQDGLWTLLDLSGDMIAGVEALLRSNRPLLGNILPDRFIFGVSVNLSAKPFKASELMSKVMSALHFSGMSQHQLELQITESRRLSNRAGP